MNNDTVRFAVHQVADRIGLAIRAKLTINADGQTCECIPADGHPNESFAVQFRIGWRSAEAVFVPGQFSGALIKQMGGAGSEAQDAFAAVAKGLESRRIRIQMRLNGADVSAVNPSTWPTDWTRLELALRTQPMVIGESDEPLHERLMLELVVPLFGMMAALIGVEENEPETTGEVEGRAIQTLSTRYERKKVNREACIQLKGTRCCVCGFDFAERYGPIGIGYIEIHHTKSIATLGDNYRLKIETDLAPLCSNCHAMAHREEPPIEIERLRAIFETRRVAGQTMQ